MNKFLLFVERLTNYKYFMAMILISPVLSCIAIMVGLTLDLRYIYIPAFIFVGIIFMIILALVIINVTIINRIDRLDNIVIVPSASGSPI